MALMENLGSWHLLSKCFDSIPQWCPMTKIHLLGVVLHSLVTEVAGNDASAKATLPPEFF